MSQTRGWQAAAVAFAALFAFFVFESLQEVFRKAMEDPEHVKKMEDAKYTERARSRAQK